MGPTENWQGYLRGLEEVGWDQHSCLLPHSPLERQMETLQAHNREEQEIEITILQVDIHPHLDPPSASGFQRHRCF